MSEEFNRLPRGYVQTLECLNQPDSWDAPGMIADMAEHLRNEFDVPPGQLLAAIDWMTFRLKEAAAAMREVTTSDMGSDNRFDECLKKLKGY